jgi:hypothetical protein
VLFFLDHHTRVLLLLVYKIRVCEVRRKNPFFGFRVELVASGCEKFQRVRISRIICLSVMSVSRFGSSLFPQYLKHA